MLGTLVAGLGVNSRTKQKVYGIKEPVPEMLLLARILDDLELFRWWRSGQKKKNKPEPITPFILGQNEPNKKTDLSKDAIIFEDGKAFDKARARLLGEENAGN